MSTSRRMTFAPGQRVVRLGRGRDAFPTQRSDLVPASAKDTLKENSR